MCTNTEGVTHFHAHVTNSHVSGAVRFLAHKMVALWLTTLPKRISDSEIRFSEHHVDVHAKVYMFHDNEALCFLQPFRYNRFGFNRYPCYDRFVITAILVMTVSLKRSGIQCRSNGRASNLQFWTVKRTVLLRFKCGGRGGSYIPVTSFHFPTHGATHFVISTFSRISSIWGITITVHVVIVLHCVAYYFVCCFGRLLDWTDDWLVESLHDRFVGSVDDWLVHWRGDCLVDLASKAYLRIWDTH